jgi:hypothetical protein
LALRLKIFYILYFFKSRVIGKHGRKYIGGCWKGSKNSFEAMRVPEKHDKY